MITYIYFTLIAIIAGLLLFHSIQIYPVFPKKKLFFVGIIVFLGLVVFGYCILEYKLFSGIPLFHYYNIILFSIYIINIYLLIRSILIMDDYKKLEARND